MATHGSSLDPSLYPAELQKHVPVLGSGAAGTTAPARAPFSSFGNRRASLSSGISWPLHHSFRHSLCLQPLEREGCESDLLTPPRPGDAVWFSLWSHPSPAYPLTVASCLRAVPVHLRRLQRHSYTRRILPRLPLPRPSPGAAPWHPWVGCWLPLLAGLCAAPCAAAPGVFLAFSADKVLSRTGLVSCCAA